MKFYRYNTNLCASGDDDYGFHVSCRVELVEYDMIKETPKGYWIGYNLFRDTWFDKHFVLKDSKKKYAYPDKETALESFIIRKQRQIERCESDIGYARDSLAIAEYKKKHDQFE